MEQRKQTSKLIKKDVREGEKEIEHSEKEEDKTK